MDTIRFPRMDWRQVVLNGGPPCFAILDDEGGWFCGRAKRWEGHDGEHKFVWLADYLQHREEQVRIHERVACAVIADERAAFNRRLARTHKIGDPMADLKHTRADEAEVIAKEIRDRRTDSNA